MAGIRLRLRIYEFIPAAGLLGLSLNLICLYGASVWRTHMDIPAIFTGWGAALLIASLAGGWPVRQALRSQSPSSRWSELRAKAKASLPELMPVGLLLAGWALVLGLAFYQVLMFTDEGVKSTVVFDLPVHMAMIHGFVEGEAVPLQNPFFAGRPLLYPFAVNLMSAMLIKLGLTLPASLSLPGVLLSLAMLSLLYGLTLRLTGRRKAALLAPAILLCNGGMGWIYYLIELKDFGFNPWQTLQQYAHNYTDMPDYGLQWFNLMRYFLLPQRSTLLGLPLLLLVALGIVALQQQDEIRVRRQPWAWLLLGLAAGCLPLMHTHSFIALGLMLPLWTLLTLRRNGLLPWASFWAGLSLTSLPQLLWMYSARGDSHFLFRPLAGWHGWGDSVPSPLFWLYNAGTLLVLLAIGLWQREQPQLLRRWSLVSLILFLMPNFFLFAPYEGDNMKLLVVWYLFSVPLASLMLVRLWERRRLLGALTAVLLMGAGFLDLLKVTVTSSNQMIQIPNDALTLAHQLPLLFAPGTVIAIAPDTNHLWYFSGRPALLAGGRYVYSYGIDPNQRENDLKEFYTTQDCAKAAQILQKYPQVKAVIWSRYEQHYYEIEKSCVPRLYPLAYKMGEYELYRAEPLPGPLAKAEAKASRPASGKAPLAGKTHQAPPAKASRSRT